jgi:hypothetical protein
MKEEEVEENIKVTLEEDNMIKKEWEKKIKLGK